MVKLDGFAYITINLIYRELSSFENTITSMGCQIVYVDSLYGIAFRGGILS